MVVVVVGLVGAVRVAPRMDDGFDGRTAVGAETALNIVERGRSGDIAMNI